MADGTVRAAAAAAVKKQPPLATSDDPAEWWEAAVVILSKEVDAGALGKPAITTKDNRTEYHGRSDTTAESKLNQMWPRDTREIRHNN
jgi:hypothetical protein